MMNLRKRMTKYIKNSVASYYLLLLVKKMRADYLSWKYTDEELVIRSYRKATGIELDLSNPLRFTEKLQWLKLNYNSPHMSRCADKHAVRQYVESKGYRDILNEVIGVYSHPDEITLAELPGKFIIKTTHSSGWNIICTDKQKIVKSWNWWKKILKLWLKEDFSKYYQERHYSSITPQIVCERFLGDSVRGLTDYKFFCFNGMIRLIEVDVQRYTSHKQNFYDENWNYLDVSEGYGDHFDHHLYKPKNLEEMKKISEKLSKGFPHARVDLFEWEDKIYFGEITFIDGSGFYKTEPAEFDYKMGEWLELPAVSDI